METTAAASALVTLGHMLLGGAAVGRGHGAGAAAPLPPPSERQQEGILQVLITQLREQQQNTNLKPLGGSEGNGVDWSSVQTHCCVHVLSLLHCTALHVAAPAAAGGAAGAAGPCPLLEVDLLAL